ncbi:MAG: radical SAM family heme chaperone HemW [Clostridium sp.]|nr:radical SAM family heme chaperone HemW [Clostridium sp.]
MELYIHIPFCVRKCRYCDFLSFPGGDADSYLFQLISEMEQAAKEPGICGKMVSSVFIGGGTPSLLHPGQFARLSDAVRKYFSMEKDAEWTIEANPGTITKEKLAAWKEGGVNRLSMGLQSAHDTELKLLGRIHTLEEFLENYAIARHMGFDNINIDLMSALPGQTLSSWKETLRTVLSLRPEHISAYSLIVEPGTPFYEEYGPMSEALEQYGEYEAMPAELSGSFSEERRLPGETLDREMYHLTKTLLAEAGYHRYEISNYALPGRECRHNRGYWDGTEYLGVGLGAASLLEHRRFSVTSDIQRYLSLSAADFAAGRHLEDIHALTEREQMEEFMFLGLRLTEGVRESRFFARFGKTMDAVYGEALGKLRKEGLLGRAEDEGPAGSPHDARWFLTERGTDVSNAVFAEFLMD